MPPPTPITIVTGFLGSGKTTILLNLVPQLPPTYRLALLKNEFGDVAVDSQLASNAAVSGVRELLNGCICCNLVGQLGDALGELRGTQGVDRIIIETSGSAFPATLAMEVNRLAREDLDEDGGTKYVLDGVASVIDVENWQGYEDTSPTARMQAKYTDLVIFNKWELVDERRFDVCLDRLGDLEVQTAWVKSDKGVVDRSILLGIDGALARALRESNHGHDHDHDHEHQKEVEVLSVSLLQPEAGRTGVDMSKLEDLLLAAPKDEVYRIKGVLYASSPPAASTGEKPQSSGSPGRYILNWAFGRWTFTGVEAIDAADEPALRLTLICAPYESTKWRRKIEAGDLVVLENGAEPSQPLKVDRVS